MKEICVWLVVASEVFFGVCYILKIWDRKATSTISTWIIFLVGSGLSFVTYFIATNQDIKSGILNTVDLAYISAILLAIILWGKQECISEEDKAEEEKCKMFERWYLAGAGAVVAYGLITGNVWRSNVLTQFLMSFAYLPMWHKMIAQKRNTESFWAWIPVSAVAAFYPAFHEGNALAVTYTVRAFVLCLATMSLMAYYEFRTSKV